MDYLDALRKYKKEIQTELEVNLDVRLERLKRLVKKKGYEESLTEYHENSSTKDISNSKEEKINNLEDLAVISQVFRDPRYETMRIFYTKNNKIVAHEAISSRIPGMSSALYAEFTAVRISCAVKVPAWYRCAMYSSTSIGEYPFFFANFATS